MIEEFKDLYKKGIEYRYLITDREKPLKEIEENVKKEFPKIKSYLRKDLDINKEEEFLKNYNRELIEADINKIYAVYKEIKDTYEFMQDVDKDLSIYLLNAVGALDELLVMKAAASTYEIKDQIKEKIEKLYQNIVDKSIKHIKSKRTYKEIINLAQEISKEIYQVHSYIKTNCKE